MKKIIKLSICFILLVACLTSCTNPITMLEDRLFYTKSYVLYRDFHQDYKVGMDKEEVVEQIGYPDRYRDADGNVYRHNYREQEREDFNKGALSDNVVIWSYDCYQLRDPANPYCLKVYFDSEGKCTNVTFEIVKGG